MQNKYSAKRNTIARLLGLSNIDEYHAWLLRKYETESKAPIEICEEIRHITGMNITPRSIQRALKAHYPERIRKVGDAFRNAVARGRVQWVYKTGKLKRKYLNPRLRALIMKRDNYKCVQCGATAAQDLLEIDHKIPVCNGGLTIESNLRVLCYQCNVGKRLIENER